MTLGSTFDTVLLGAVAVPLLVWIGAALVRRPQRGLLLLAALLPFDGLLLILPGGGSFGAWKEALLVVTLLASLVAPVSARREKSSDVAIPSWVPVAIVFVALGAVSAVVAGGAIGFWGFKIGYFYVVVPFILWRCPFDARDRDRVVTVLMAAGALTAAYGLYQQAIGPVRLNEMGYEYNSAIRFSGSLLRSFSSFTQPFSFGLFVMLVLLVCLPVAMADPRRVRNALFLLITPVLVVSMASSVVRGAMLGLAVGLVLLAFWRFRGLVHAFVPASLTLLLVPGAALSAFLSSSSLNERTSGWSLIFERVLAAPFGNGVGTTGAAAEKAVQLGADSADVITVGTAGQPQLYLPDNQYVKTVLELGPVGLYLLLLLGATVVVSAVAASRRTIGDDRALAQGIAASVVGAAAASFVSTYLEIFPLDFYFWLTVGMLLCLDRPSSSTPLLSAPPEVASRPTSVSSSAR
ncbi:hypothetical protein [Nocardioides sp.]|uniref:hypothetical protein n=1 Tax=Nocardioides sp. TaxID=35761 RepID=UPI002718F1E6|nr:hypothetical protein [Nocardioides sp.]MDO9454932.1 hypothetical protein [Nocardioides sp.]